MADSSQFCTFSLAHLLFGIELRDVQEVVRSIEMTPVPLAPSEVIGLINLRGQIVTVIDLHKRLDLEPRSVSSAAMNVVVRTDEGSVSVLVDEIGDVVEVGEDTFEPPPETLQGAARSVIAGVHKLHGRLLHVLDAGKVCQIGQALDVQ
jgi:purine-binding chemotaxis protein CheW